jgi:hypothetical protein
VIPGNRPTLKFAFPEDIKATVGKKYKTRNKIMQNLRYLVSSFLDIFSPIILGMFFKFALAA